jgi:hypothetical protein
MTIEEAQENWRQTCLRVTGRPDATPVMPPEEELAFDWTTDSKGRRVRKDKIDLFKTKSLPGDRK